LITFLDRAAAAWWDWMAPMAWQVALLAVFAAVIDRLTRRRLWRELRLALWLLLITRLAIPPSWSSTSSLASLVHGAPFSMLSAPMASGTADVAERSGLSFVLAAFAAWLAGIGVCACFEIHRQRLLFRDLANEPQPTRLPAELIAALDVVARRIGLARVPAILISRHFASPAVVGVFRPCVILPVEFVLERKDRGRDRAFEAMQLEHALLHELAHLRRKDLLAAAIIRVFAIVYWFHPAVWLAQGELALLRELGCDATVSSHLREKTSEYRATLLERARASIDASRPMHWSRADFWHGQSQLLLRLAALERPIWKFARHRRATSTIVFALIVAFVLPMAPSQELGIAEPGSPRTRALAARSSDELRARDVEAAITNLSRVADGGTRQSCLRLQCSATLLANAGIDGSMPSDTSMQARE
jgi:beta-lactamase regulating signal transducer with metallopeptidase domain